MEKFALKDIHPIARTKAFVSRHRVIIAVVGTIYVMGKLQGAAQRDQMNFIESEGLLDKYLNPEFAQELAEV